MKTLKLQYGNGTQMAEVTGEDDKWYFINRIMGDRVALAERLLSDPESYTYDACDKKGRGFGHGPTIEAVIKKANWLLTVSKKSSKIKKSDQRIIEVIQ